MSAASCPTVRVAMVTMSVGNVLLDINYKLMALVSSPLVGSLVSNVIQPMVAYVSHVFHLPTSPHPIVESASAATLQTVLTAHPPTPVSVSAAELDSLSPTDSALPHVPSPNAPAAQLSSTAPHVKLDTPSLMVFAFPAPLDAPHFGGGFSTFSA